MLWKLPPPITFPPPVISTSLPPFPFPLRFTALRATSLPALTFAFCCACAMNAASSIPSSPSAACRPFPLRPSGSPLLDLRTEAGLLEAARASGNKELGASVFPAAPTSVLGRFVDLPSCFGGSPLLADVDVDGPRLVEGPASSRKSRAFAMAPTEQSVLLQPQTVFKSIRRDVSQTTILLASID